LTDISGICTLQLPDLVVLMFSLNEQSILGITSALHSIKYNRLNRDILTKLVASPVPDSPAWLEKRAARLEHAKKTMGLEADEVLPFDPALAFGESIVYSRGAASPTDTLSTAYDSLAQKILEANSSDIVTMLLKAARLRNEGRLEAAAAEYEAIVTANPNNAQAWAQFGNFELLRGKSARAADYLERAYSIEPFNRSALAQLSSVFAGVNKAKCEKYFLQYLDLAVDTNDISAVSSALRSKGMPQLALRGYLKSRELGDRSLDILTGLGETQMQLRQYPEAANTYLTALELDPNNLGGVFNAGLALEKSGDSRANEYFARAVDIFEQTKRPVEKAALANMEEAMSRAYQSLGNITRALELLESAVIRARECPASSKFFSSSRYMYVSQERFISDVMVRLREVKSLHPVS
jgi:tetratricopeptide (TPR) repeat protein